MTEYDCPNGCDEILDYGEFADAREGIRGYTCDSCNTIWTTMDLKLQGVIDD